MKLLQAFRLAVLLAAPCLHACALGISTTNTVSAGAESPFPYTRTVWQLSDGLPEDTVQAIAESPQGLLWIGTTGGLVRFDGARMEVYDANRLPASSANSIFCLLMARDGSLWAGTEGGGLLRLKNGSMRVYSAADGLSDGFVRSIFEDDRGRLWVGTDDGLFRRDGNHFVRWNDGTALSDIAVHSITEDREHRIWVGGSSLLTIGPSGRAQTYKLPGAYSENRVKRILQTSDGTVWVGTVGGLEQLRDGRFVSVPGIHATVRSLLESDDGTLWIGTIGNGLWALRPSGNGARTLTRISRPTLLPSDTILSLFEDNNHQIWVGTQDGLERFNKTPVTLIPLPESGDPDFETISGNAHGDVWVAARRLYLVRNGVASPVSYGLPAHVSVRNVFEAHDGSLWIGTDGDGVYHWLAPGSLTHYTAPTQLPNNFVRGFAETRHGSIWVACDEGVAIIRAGGVKKLDEADGLAYFSTRSLLVDRDGSMWIGTDRGLSHWSNGAFRQDIATRTLANEKIWTILQDRRGILWFGTRDHGLFRLRDGVVAHFTMADGLPSDSLYQILQDRRGTFWMTGPNTIASVPEQDLDDARPSSSDGITVDVYSMPFGGDNVQLYGGRQPAGYLGPDDSVWFPTNRGIARVFPVTEATHTPPRAFLESVREDGRDINLTGNVLKVPARIGRISFTFSAAFLEVQSGLHFRYFLENFDKGWNNATSSREAVYTNLPAGHYIFRVVAFDSARPAAISEASIAIDKLPYFYQTWWFYTVCALVLGGIVWTTYWLRVRQMRTRFTAVLAERGRIAREMHDTVIQGCTGISALLEAAAATSSQDATTRDELLELARRQARSTVSEAREVVWGMRHEHEGDTDLVHALSSLTHSNGREPGAAVHFNSGVERLTMKNSVAHEILMTAREAVANAQQHSGSPAVVVDLKTGQDDIVVRVTDHGRGFPVDANDAGEHHYGILGMKERAQRIGARLTLRSAEGQGTCVELEVPMASLTRSAARKA